MHVRDRIADAVITALKKGGVAEPAPGIEFPADSSHGDYATGVALKYAKQLGLAPRALADTLVADIGSISGVAKTDIAGPGFINFHLDLSVFATALETARTEKTWGANILKRDEEILIEYTSPNLFKPLHIGNLVGNVIGESVSRLMQFSGAIVRRINYPSDIGLTVAKGVWGLKQTQGNPSDIAALGEAYRRGNEAYENDSVAKAEIEAVNKALYDQSDTVLNALRERGVATSRMHLDELCKKLGTTFDFELFESEVASVGQDIVQKNPHIFLESDGARVFNGSHTRVFLTSKDLPTYEAKDLGNFVLKQRRFPGWRTYVVVTGLEQKEYFKVLFEAIHVLFPETTNKRLLHIATSFLTLTTGKMSSRLGNVLTGESLFADLAEAAKERATESRAEDKNKLAEHIGVAALKYEILKQGMNKNIIFDKQKALSLEGDSGPYLQYAHARACQIVARAEEEGVIPKTDVTAEPSDLGRILYRFPEIVAYATEKLEPHIVANYALEIASMFNSWYANVQVLDGTPEAAHKVAVTDAVRATLRKSLWLLGIPAPEKM